MVGRKVNVCICSEIEDINSIVSLLYGIGNQNFNLTLSNPAEISFEEQDIIVFYLNKFSDTMLGSVERIKLNAQAKLCAVLEGNDIQLLSTLAKMGLKDLFVFPYELFKFDTYITELISSFPISTGTSDELNNSEPSFVGNFPGIDNIISLSRKASENPSLNVLLLGDTGTGKSVLAKMIHLMGEKKSAPFIHVICTAIPENLLESELFGYEKGAFTDAKNRKIGLFELSEGGTIFLDEIGDLSLNLQAKLLHVTEKKVIRRLGGVRDISINTRIITATNRDIFDQIEKNLFRRDLFYRLNMITLKLPPLIEREGDIVLLTEHFVNEFSRTYNKNIKCLSDEAWNNIKNYKWPGNVRELRHIVERAVLLSDGPVLDERYFMVINPLQINLAEQTEEKDKSLEPKIIIHSSGNNSGKILLEVNYNELTLLDVNKLYARELLERLSGNKSKTAKLLGISRPTLDNLLS